MIVEEISQRYIRIMSTLKNTQPLHLCAIVTQSLKVFMSSGDTLKLNIWAILAAKNARKLLMTEIF